MQTEVNFSAASLYELTGQNSGIVCFQDGGVIVYTAATTDACKDNSLPASFANAIVDYPLQHPWTVAGGQWVEDIRDSLPGTIEVAEDSTLANPTVTDSGMDLVFDANCDVPMLFGFDCGLGAEARTDSAGDQVPTPGMVYELKTSRGDVTVIAPEGWD